MREHGKLLLKGAGIGIANIIPGVSGGTMAVVFGIYERLMEAIPGVLLDSKRRWEHLLFLAILGIGAIAGILLLVNLITWALEVWPGTTYLLFMGLILGSLPPLIRSFPRDCLSQSGIWAVLGMIAVFLLGSGSPESGAGVGPVSPMWWSFVLGGALAGAAMIMPGVSGSLVLVLMGLYKPVTEAIKSLDIVSVAWVGLGAALGIVVFARLIRWLLRSASNPTHAFILGMVAASVIVIFQGFDPAAIGVLAGSLAFILGCLVGSRLG